ncbi:MAG: hypothetical protein A3A96_03165 [Candidatus Zambryskibacteria bacterium RIFCSPLOWO2_01_FULL_39_39]|uniref:TrbL/VirB6 plasmid conjugal transfer protein n=1 Tax=Candidatus Zambryskibacteria bacterium RIFCSPLOWO2_01_FULL_39_39 TaxID=1802758 RepID=A0A1G2TYD8_9BACT|nr:MAG: hypothetical protein UT00_C0008G0011 [Parcubacteria group bacterium GW2011_GWA1_38_7]OHA87658.1 MAG: hypothetical protein A2644_02555 [Candidatus Zambryskibacteria bacterium RIFCSPHIGHO2_01_FULL_39_63]OHA94406.1 MAG: hypothetical protein A3B88_01760 [Candidatus Zambryskibacteria bacterium RIFCSPHIGHO2_02_FULL_39_19]OHA98782.1 MAG: hypothetical protein A3F20_00850 [Candidatus Zambryskibacteria bacterium RIFCSPHIGHO2_12_FULL_39_21]OHB01640.1 MAG: hypothetical protein A3A96_03165 [Candidat
MKPANIINKKNRKFVISNWITLGILTVVLVGVSIPSVVFGAECTPAELAAGGRNQTFSATGASTVACVMPTQPGQNSSVAGVAVDYLVSPLFQGIARLLMGFSSLILMLSGLIFDKVIDFSIVKMATNIGDPNGVGGSITVAWATLRDVANICFIFVLLYAAFKAMFELNFGSIGKTIKDIIIVALLINFSLFFSKVVIDASNIVADGFYKSIASNTATLDASGNRVEGKFSGISAGYMNMLGMQTFYSANVLDNPNLKDPVQILIIGIMTSVFMLIAAVIFLIAGIMFAARFIILIFLMILSPLAAIAFIFPSPGIKKHFDEWWNALVAQSFFAPLYFALTWVVFKLGTSLVKINPATGPWTELTTNPQSAMALIVNYVLIIGFSIAALVFAKKMASSTYGFKEISGGIGTVAIGGAALAGRTVIGRGSSLISETQREKWSKSATGRAGLWLANKGGKASYDARGLADTKLGKTIGASDVMGIAGKAGGVGGFVKAVEDKAKEKAKYAKGVYGQTDTEKEAFEKAKKDEEAEIRAGRATVANQTKSEADRAENERRRDLNDKLKPYTENQENIKREKQEKERELDVVRRSGDVARTEMVRKELDSINTRLSNEIKLKEEAKKEIEENDEIYKKLAEVANDKKDVAKEAEKRKNKKEIDDEEYSESTQKMKKAGEERQKAYAEKTRSGSPVSTSSGAIVGGVLGGLAGPIGSVIGAGIGAGIGKYAGGKMPEKFNWAGNKAAAREIMKQAKGKSPNEKAADLLKEMKEAEDKAKGGGGGTPTPPPPPPPPTTT